MNQDRISSLISNMLDVKGSMSLKGFEDEAQQQLTTLIPLLEEANEATANSHDFALKKGQKAKGNFCKALMTLAQTLHPAQSDSGFDMTEEGVSIQVYTVMMQADHFKK